MDVSPTLNVLLSVHMTLFQSIPCMSLAQESLAATLSAKMGVFLRHMQEWRPFLAAKRPTEEGEIPMMAPKTSNVDCGLIAQHPPLAMGTDLSGSAALR